MDQVLGRNKIDQNLSMILSESFTNSEQDVWHHPNLPNCAPLLNVGTKYFCPREDTTVYFPLSYFKIFLNKKWKHFQ